jgi:hypothetical protein
MLRNVSDVLGYTINAVDGAIGGTRPIGAERACGAWGRTWAV